jgi:hypothetical protein
MIDEINDDLTSVVAYSHVAQSVDNQSVNNNHEVENKVKAPVDDNSNNANIFRIVGLSSLEGGSNLKDDVKVYLQKIGDGKDVLKNLPNINFFNRKTNKFRKNKAKPKAEKRTKKQPKLFDFCEKNEVLKKAIFRIKKTKKIKKPKKSKKSKLPKVPKEPEKTSEEPENKENKKPKIKRVKKYYNYDKFSYII